MVSEHDDAGQNRSAEVFFQREARLISDFASGLNVSFKMGSGWAVDPKNGEATYDPKFFVEKGYTESQAIFATLHEIDHIKEMSQIVATEAGRQVIENRRAIEQQNPHIGILDNTIEDLGNNARVLQFAPSLAGEAKVVYKTKLFPETDCRKDPLHMQFIQKILREGMVPDEEVLVDERVSQAIHSLRNVKSKSDQVRDILSIVTDPNLDYKSKIKLVEKYVDSVFTELYEEDLKNKEDNQKGSSQGSPGDQQGGGDQFAKEHQEYWDKVSGPLSDKDVDNAAAQGSSSGGGNDASRQQAGFEAEHGVNMQDTLEYRKEYEKVKGMQGEMEEPIRKLVMERMIPKRKLVGFREEGALIASGLVAQAQLDFKRGVFDPMVFMDFEGRNIRVTVPRVLEATCVFDRSGSMGTGGKMDEQRRAAILFMETLHAVMDQPEIRDGLIYPDLEAKSEVRSFGGPKENVVIKPLGTSLSEKDRVEVFKVLGNTPGAGTEDYIVLGQIIDEIKSKGQLDPQYLEEIKRREIVKLVVVFSDGGSSDSIKYANNKKVLEDLGVKVVEYRQITDNTPFTNQMSGILKESLSDISLPQTGGN